mgnify:CR=1 FL=1
MAEENNLTLEALDQRLSALEEAASYQLHHSGPAIDTILDMAAEFEIGRETFTVSSADDLAFKPVALSIEGDVTENTQVLAGVMMEGVPSNVYEHRITVYARKTASSTVMAFVEPFDKGSNMPSALGSKLPAGTYHVDWLVIRR